jgi:isoprenylcysteine carboxyl methyltransferase (ICMT) family protein YpbQ
MSQNRLITAVVHTHNVFLLVQVIQMWMYMSDIWTLDYHGLVPTLWIFLSQVVKWYVTQSLIYCVWPTRNALLLVQVIQMLTNQADISTLDS